MTECARGNMRRIPSFSTCSGTSRVAGAVSRHCNKIDYIPSICLFLSRFDRCPSCLLLAAKHTHYEICRFRTAASTQQNGWEDDCGSNNGLVDTARSTLGALRGALILPNQRDREGEREHRRQAARTAAEGQGKGPRLSQGAPIGERS